MKVSNRALVIAVIVLLAVSLGVGLFFLTRPSGPRVIVTVNGKPFASYDLYRDQTVVLSPADGKWHNTLVIANKTACITESDCDNQICVHTPALTEDYFGIIVCLPHGLAVELGE